KKLGVEKIIPLESFYFAMGFKPNSSLIKGQVSLDKEGYVVVTPRKNTSKPLVYAAGTIIDPIYQKGLISSSMGAEAAISLIQDLQDAGFSPTIKSELEDKFYTVEEPPLELESISTPQELAEYVKNNPILFVNFFATNCPACKAM